MSTENENTTGTDIPTTTDVTTTGGTPTTADVPPTLTVTAVSTIEPTAPDDRGSDAWMVIETAEQGQFLLNLPGPLSQAVKQATYLPSHLAGDGRLPLSREDSAAYRARVAALVSPN
ncbi:hypothetical protein OEIGOIKO_00376 [Streptomyces chrestomyceticus JCM 4735]|uniref:Uncharacterized protein n=1 Tax=Streptomyces chrestomyceticus JCM 4735 TaxID=1306181 RepID=A0A7U9KNU6_9ACTN|nr:hypothetical protein [Streptomyces chrestomyceticus]GCD32659.1 hypothetical protein OEIGOIKO_00376 [Streptomyces chrestomyceticus JCM 4735]